MIDLSGKELKAIAINGQRSVTLKLDVRSGLYILQPFKGLQKRKPYRLIVKN